MKKSLLILFVLLASCSLAFAQQHESHWSDFDYHDFENHALLVAFVGDICLWMTRHIWATRTRHFSCQYIITLTTKVKKSHLKCMITQRGWNTRVGLVTMAFLREMNTSRYGMTPK